MAHHVCSMKYRLALSILLMPALACASLISTASCDWNAFVGVDWETSTGFWDEGHIQNTGTSGASCSGYQNDAFAQAGYGMARAMAGSVRPAYGGFSFADATTEFIHYATFTGTGSGCSKCWEKQRNAVVGSRKYDLLQSATCALAPSPPPRPR